VPEGGVDWLKQNELKSAAEIDRMLAAGEIDGPTAREMYGKLREELIDRDFHNREDPKVQEQIAEIEKIVAEKGEGKLTEAQRVQRDYYAILDEANASGTFDFDLYNQRLDEWIAENGDKRDLISSSRAPLSPQEAELKDLRVQLNNVGWFDANESAYQLAIQANPTLAQIAPTYAEAEAKVKAIAQQALQTQSAGRPIDPDALDNAWYKFQQNTGLINAVMAAQVATIVKDPSILPGLQKWYDLYEPLYKLTPEALNAIIASTR
jgi:hypothetical protein